MRITAQKLKEIVEDAISFYNEYQGNDGKLKGDWGDYLIEIDDLNDLNKPIYHNDEVMGYMDYNNASMHRKPVAYKDKNINVDFKTSETKNERHQYIKKLPKPKQAPLVNGGITVFKYALVTESFKDDTGSSDFYLDCEDMEELPAVFNNLLIRARNTSMTFIGKKLKSFKNLFKCVYVHAINFYPDELPSFETFEHLGLSKDSVLSVKFHGTIKNFNGFQKIPRDENNTIYTNTDISVATGVESFYGLPINHVGNILTRTSLHSNSTEVMEAFNNYFGIITKHKDLYEDPVKDNIMKVYNPKTVAIFDMYYNNMESYKGIDINIINKLTYHLLK